MAIIQCPECGKDVSNSAKNCPNCGYPIAENTNDLIRIKIDQHPNVPGCSISINEFGRGGILRSLRVAEAGSVAEIRSDHPIQISFHDIGFMGVKKSPMFITTVSPDNGGRYRASWGVGLLSPRISSCSKVDVIDS